MLYIDWHELAWLETPPVGTVQISNFTNKGADCVMKPHLSAIPLYAPGSYTFLSNQVVQRWSHFPFEHKVLRVLQARFFPASADFSIMRALQPFALSSHTLLLQASKHIFIAYGYHKGICTASSEL